MSLRLIGTVAGLVIGLTVPSIANAYTQCATGTVNVRSGPGVNYSKVGALYPGQAVETYSCDYGWCRILYNRYTAYVSDSYLGRCYNQSYKPPVYHYQPRYVPPPPPPVYHPPYPTYPLYRPFYRSY
jgi:uncharacterized protein YraI